MNGERKRIIIDAFKGFMYNKYTYCNGFEVFLHNMTMENVKNMRARYCWKINNIQDFENSKFKVRMSRLNFLSKRA